jgi:hypothetical protein
MKRAKRIVTAVSIVGALFAIAPVAHADAPGPGSKQCLDHATGNSRCPQNK